MKYEEQQLITFNDNTSLTKMQIFEQSLPLSKLKINYFSRMLNQDHLDLQDELLMFGDRTFNRIL